MSEDRRVFGKYRALCKDVHDPERLGRIRVYCPAVYGNSWSDWASPNFIPGSFILPEEDTWVWIEFEEGDPQFPIWTGIWYDRQTGAPKQELHAAHSGRSGLVDKDKTEHEPHPIDSVERKPFRNGQYYDGTKHIIYRNEQGMEIWVDQWTDGKGGIYFKDRAGNEIWIKDDITNTFKYTDMGGNVIQMKDDYVRVENGKGAKIVLDGTHIELNSQTLTLNVPGDVNFSPPGSSFTAKTLTKVAKLFKWRGQDVESDKSAK